MFRAISDFIVNNYVGIAIGIITGLAATAIFQLINNIRWRIKIGKSRYSGHWVQMIYPKYDLDYACEPEKIDVYTLKHKKFKYTGKLIDNVSGTIQRVYPPEQCKRSWDFFGYLDGGIMTILYQADEGQKSRGCIYLKLKYQNGLDDFRGYYLEEHDDGTIDKTPVVLFKVEEKK